MIRRNLLRRLSALVVLAVLFSGCSALNFAGLRQDGSKKSAQRMRKDKRKAGDSWFSGWFAPEKKEPQSVRDWMKEYKPMRLPGSQGNEE